MVLQLLYQLCPSAASVAPVHAQRACNFKGLFAAEFTFRVAEPPWVLFHHWLTFREHLVLLSSFFLASILLLKSYHFIYLFIFLVFSKCFPLDVRSHFAQALSFVFGMPGFRPEVFSFNQEPVAPSSSVSFQR